MSKSFGDRLRQARDKAGLKQSDLASLTEINQSEISRLEKSKRKRPPGWPQVVKLATALSVTPEWLFGTEEIPGGPSFARFQESLHGKAADLTPEEIAEYSTQRWWGLGDREPEPAEWYEYITLRRRLKKNGAK